MWSTEEEQGRCAKVAYVNERMKCLRTLQSYRVEINVFGVCVRQNYLLSYIVPEIDPSVCPRKCCTTHTRVIVEWFLCYFASHGPPNLIEAG